MRKLLLLFTTKYYFHAVKMIRLVKMLYLYIRAKGYGEQKVFSNLVTGQKELDGSNLVYLTLSRKWIKFSSL